MVTNYEREAAEDLIEEGIEAGIKVERERILEQWQYEMSKCSCDDAMAHMERRIKAELLEREEK